MPPSDATTALVFGTLVGFLVQLVATRLRYNGRWDELDVGWKVAMSATGAIAAFVAGTYILSEPPSDPAAPFVYRLWLWQTVAAWSGALLLDLSARVLAAAVRAGGRDE